MKNIHTSLCALGLMIATSALAQQPGVPLPGNSSSSSPGASAAPAPAAAPDALAIVGNRLYLIRDGQATLQDRTLTLTISAAGLVGFDGRTVEIPRGMMISMSGQLVPMPANIPGLPLGLSSGTAGSASASGTTIAPAAPPLQVPETTRLPAIGQGKEEPTKTTRSSAR